jgi:hypothetical protein
MGSRTGGGSSSRGGGVSQISTSLSSSSMRVCSCGTGSRCSAIMDRRCAAIMDNSWLLGKLSQRGLKVATDWHSSFSKSGDGIS